MPRPKKDRVLPHIVRAQLALRRGEDAHLSHLLEQAALHRAASIASGQPRTSAPPTDPRIAKAIAHLHQNIGDRRMTVADLAGVAAMSIYHFTRKFGDVTGHPPRAYLRQKRLELAREMLAHRQNLSLVDVSLKCGFASQAHFSTAFKQWAGISPGVFRKAAQRRK